MGKTETVHQYRMNYNPSTDGPTLSSRMATLDRIKQMGDAVEIVPNTDVKIDSDLLVNGETADGFEPSR